VTHRETTDNRTTARRVFCSEKELDKEACVPLQQIDVTGARLVGAITKELGFDGPKHHPWCSGKECSTA